MATEQLAIESEPTDDEQEVDAMEPELTAGPPTVVRRPAAIAPHRPMSLADFLAQNATPEALEANTRMMEAFDKACLSLLTKNDIVKDAATGREFKKKSAWKKLGRQFGISVEMVERRSWYDEEDGVRHFNAEVVMRATAPWGQYADAIGGCSTREEKYVYVGVACPKCGGPTWDNRDPSPSWPDWKKAKHGRGELPPFECRNKQCKEAIWEFDPAEADGGSKPNPTARAKALHDVTATAQTRASNRAISDLIAAGEVSWEEVEGTVEREREAPSNGRREPTDDAADQRAAQDGKPDLSALQAEVKSGKNKGRTYADLVRSDRNFCEYMLGRIEGKPRRLRNPKLVAALEWALDHQETEAAAATDASHQPPTQQQYDELADLLDTRAWPGDKPEWLLWARRVHNREGKIPSRAGFEAALARYRDLPEKAAVAAATAAEGGDVDDTDDLPF